MDVQRAARTACLIALAVGGSSLAAAPGALAAPTDVVVEPRVTAAGEPVLVTGTGCTGAVAVEVGGREQGTGAPVVERSVVEPDAAGVWAHAFAMPDHTAYVAATCDGQSAVPAVVTPADHSHPRFLFPRSGDADHLVHHLGGLVDGSQVEVLTTAGDLVTAGSVTGGWATVRLPRALGGSTFLVLELGAKPPGVDLPYIPQASLWALPHANPPTLAADPRVAPTGTPVVARGSCDGTVRLQVEGQADGWYDVPPTHVDQVLPTTGGSWSTAFPMPPDPSTVTALCTVGTVTEHVRLDVAPSDGTPIVADVRAGPDGGGWIVTAPDCTYGPVDAFTPDGVPVPLRPGTGRSEVIIDGRPGPVYLLGVDTFGENASARQTTRPQICRAALPGPVVTPAPTTTPPAPGGGGTQDAVVPTGGRPTARTQLAAGGAAPPWAWAGGLVVTGATLVVTARRARAAARA